MSSTPCMLDDTMTFVMAGGAGKRLRPLTAKTPKPLVPFGGVFRILDFTLSNCRNSGLPAVAVLSQFESGQVGRHLDRIWGAGDTRFVHRPSGPREPYAGTADAVRQNLELAVEMGARDVLVLSADHVYRADYRDLVRFHRDSGADVTVSAARVPLVDARHFGVLEVDGVGEVTGFAEKPKCPAPHSGGSGTALASMGVYVFGLDILADALLDRTAPMDFGRDVLPEVLERRQVMAWEFRDPRTGGSFWRDVGTFDGYHEAHMVALDPGSGFDPFDPDWPIPACADSFVPTDAGVRGRVRRSVLSPGVRVGEGADIHESVLLDGVDIGPGTVVRRAVVGPGVRIPAGETIGIDPVSDRERFRVTGKGLAVIDDASVFDESRVVRVVRPRAHPAYA